MPIYIKQDSELKKTDAPEFREPLITKRKVIEAVFGILAAIALAYALINLFSVLGM